MPDRCAVPRCRGQVAIFYLDHGICDDCWIRFTADDVPPDTLRMVLGIEADAPDALEEPMAKRTDETKTTPTTAKAPVKPKPAAKKRTTKPKAAAVTKKKTAPKSRKEKPPKEELCVFAFRLTPAERDAIHKTAGPRNATKFVRRVAVAFARGDDAAFRGVIKEARAAR